MKTQLACMVPLALVGAADEAHAQNGFDVLEIDDNSGCQLTASYTMPRRPTVRLSVDQQIGGEIFVMVQSYMAGHALPVMMRRLWASCFNAQEPMTGRSLPSSRFPWAWTQ